MWGSPTRVRSRVGGLGCELECGLVGVGTQGWRVWWTICAVEFALTGLQPPAQAVRVDSERAGPIAPDAAHQRSAGGLLSSGRTKHRPNAGFLLSCEIFARPLHVGGAFDDAAFFAELNDDERVLR